MIEFDALGFDDEKIVRLYQDPYIQRIGYEGRPAAPIDHEAAMYFGAFVDGVFIGAYCLIRQSSTEFDVHSLLRKEVVELSRVIGVHFIAFAFQRFAIARMTAWVAEGMESTVNYCRKIGFQYEGFKRDAFMKRGRLMGVHMLGITRRDL